MSRSLVVSFAVLGVAGLLAVPAVTPSIEGERPSSAPRPPPASNGPPSAGDAAVAAAPAGRGSVASSLPRARSTTGSASTWQWPLVPRPPVLRRFRAPPSPWAAGHRGLDLAARPGDGVLAVASGRVTHRGTVAGRGTVTVLHDGGLRSTYEPLDPSVSVGDVVTAGQRLGVVRPGVGASASHCGSLVCLHLGARRDDAYVDPWPLLVRGRLALLPLR